MALTREERRERARLREKKKREAHRAAHNQYRDRRNAARRAAHNAEARAAEERRRQQREFFGQRRGRRDRMQVAAWYRAGYSVVNSFQLTHPLLIFELNGRKTIERWEDTVTKTKADQKALEQLESWNVRICQMADAIEADVAGVARGASCPSDVILDALTIELTGRFIGRMRRRDEQILKTQPII